MGNDNFRHFDLFQNSEKLKMEEWTSDAVEKSERKSVSSQQSLQVYWVKNAWYICLEKRAFLRCIKRKSFHDIILINWIWFYNGWLIMLSLDAHKKSARILSHQSNSSYNSLICRVRPHWFFFDNWGRDVIRDKISGLKS